MNSKILNIYNSLLRLTATYSYYQYYLKDCKTTVQLQNEKMKLWNEFLQEYHFFYFYSENCLQLAYNDKIKELTYKL